MSIIKLFRKFKNSSNDKPLDLSWVETDMHSHLIPGIDDGSQKMEESIELITRLSGYGFKKLIITPHIMSEFFKNTPEIINAGLEKLKLAVKEAGIDIELEAAAEYYLDEVLYEKVENKEPLLHFGSNKMVLVETGFMSKPPILLETFFKMEMLGYQPIFAHPERYMYLHQESDTLESLVDRNIPFQLNLLSLTGYYSKGVKKFAEKLIDKGLVKLVGTDCHNEKYLDAMERLPHSKYFDKLQELDLWNKNL
ncbi:tyrosine-protein phosphatase [Cyclobacterium amurskyense]|jgi:tyrosine-protein phosphatase YwqE|uniref:protein-tyrosine-phosphatase n=1 Tax=Cyclobacterium amurskyense TaxID=320787 RepID=A0A0H4PCD2_9BACT|nr:CpsB/CapC family capsule biosynthesis tyrosine phosphatase [Cyclobacterium amurskyense]AKP50795.1 Putative capsular polysaccharide biosynthesis protein [Cyclobacterium amurskyense]|tara:strand:+ start:23139 stop:23894 length:756 start_codon:yes stop_codon:yes gene_type:complete